MSFFGDVVDFESFNLGEMWNKIRKDPERIFIGAADPFSSSVWGSVLGKDYEPIVDQYGGASSDTYDKAQEQGINTGPGATMHGIARTIASFYGGQGAMKGMGNAFGGSAGGTGVTLPTNASAPGMNGGTGLLSSGGQGAQAPANMAGSSQGGLLDSMKTAGEYVQQFNQAASAAKQAGLLSPEEQPIQAPMMLPATSAPGLAQIATQNQQSINQQMQQAEMQRAQRRNMRRGLL